MEWKMESIARNGGGPGTLCWRGGFGEHRRTSSPFTSHHIYILVLAFTIVEGLFFSSSFASIFLIKKMSFDWSSQLLTLYSFYPCLLFKSLLSLPSSEVFSILSKLPISIKLFPTLLFPRSKKWTNLHVIADQELVSKKWSLNWATIECEF
jgi:hypothetical protein